GLAGLGQRLLVGPGALAAQDAGEEGDLADLLLAECQPAAQLVAQGGLAVQGVRHVQQGRGGGDGDRAALSQRLQGLQGGVQVGAPDVAAVDHACDQQFFAGPAGQLLATSDEVGAEGVDSQAAEGLDGLVGIAVVGLDQQLQAGVVGDLGELLVASLDAGQGGRVDVGDQGRLVELQPGDTAVSDAWQQAAVGFEEGLQVLQ